MEQEAAAGFSVENKIAVGENGGNRISDALSRISITNKPKISGLNPISAKERFYTNADYASGQKRRVDLKVEWDKEAEELRHHLKFKSEIVARDLLGEPNKRLSNGRELRYGEHGKIAVCIIGEKAGMWHDFSSDKGGDLFDLVQHVRGGEFKTAAEYLRGLVGMKSTGNLRLVYDHNNSNKYVDRDLVQHVRGGEFKTAAEYLRGLVGMKSTGNLRLVYDHNNSNKYVDRLKAKRLEEKIDKQKVKVTSDLLLRAKEINNKNVAYRYLREVRNISCELGGDIKPTGIYDRRSGQEFSCSDSICKR